MPLLAHAMATARAIDPERIVVVTGHEAARVDAAAREIDEDGAARPPAGSARHRARGPADPRRPRRFRRRPWSCSTATRPSFGRARWKDARCARRAARASSCSASRRPSPAAMAASSSTPTAGSTRSSRRKNRPPAIPAGAVCNSGVVVADSRIALRTPHQGGAAERQGRILPHRHRRPRAGAGSRDGGDHLPGGRDPRRQLPDRSRRGRGDLPARRAPRRDGERRDPVRPRQPSGSPSTPRWDAT